MINTKLKQSVLILLSVIMITGCNTKQGTGTAVGMGIGALLGSQFGKGAGQLVAVGVGGVAGGLIGGSIGKQMDEHDKLMAEKTANDALENAPAGKVMAWKNPDNNNEGTVTPTKTYQNNQNEYCREYTQTVTIGGETQKAYGTACRKPDGHWAIVK